MEGITFALFTQPHVGSGAIAGKLVSLMHFDSLVDFGIIYTHICIICVCLPFLFASFLLFFFSSRLIYFLPSRI